MNSYEVPEPILNSPFTEPAEHWNIIEGEEPRRLPGRRPSVYFYRDPKVAPEEYSGREAGVAIEMKLVNRIRERVNAWRQQGYPGVTRTTLELLSWWRRDGREKRLFFAQLEAAETIIFLIEARADILQGIDIPRDEPSEEKKQQGYSGFTRYSCKMATGTGKTTVMGMIAAWSILNKANERSDARFSDVVVVVCPNVTIRDRLRELDPEQGEASIYFTRDLVPSHLLPVLAQGKVIVVNWHRFEPQTTQVGGVGAKVIKTGIEVRTRQVITIGTKTTTARGKRYLTPEAFDRQVNAGMLKVLEEKRDKQGNLKKVVVESIRRVKSDTALINDVLGRDVGGKRNILVLNDEAHHAYRIKSEDPDEAEEEIHGDAEDAEEFFKEATVWVEGLDRLHKLRGINFCVDFSATPYFLGRVGRATNRPFPWVVSDFSLVDAIESGLVKIPQLAVRDPSGDAIPGYFNIWRWILPQLSSSERGASRAAPKPEAILKYADTPITMLGGLWEETFKQWKESSHDPRPPVFILVCKNTQIAKVVYDWLANNAPPPGIPSAYIEGFRNNGKVNTIRVDSRVVHETDTDQSKSDEARWMRFILDTVGKIDWPKDQFGLPIYPEGFEELAEKRKLESPYPPPGRDIRCIVSVGMLTEGWDCNTVTHIVGLRPFMSQLLCEQVVGRGLRRVSYDLKEDGKFTEEVAKIFGVPFEVVPFKANSHEAPPPQIKRSHVHANPSKSQYEIIFPRVEGYTQAIRNRITVDWDSVPALILEPGRIPPEVQMKSALLNNRGRPSLTGPGKLENVTLNPFRAGRRIQELVFDLATVLTRDCLSHGRCDIPVHALFPQLVHVVQRYIGERVIAHKPAEKIDLFLAPYYGWLVERLVEAIRPDTSQGETPEIPRYETHRGPGTTSEVDFWTSRDVREVIRSHVNFVVADTQKWEQSAAYYIDNHEGVDAFVKNAGLGFAIPYLHNGQTHDYIPDFIIRLKSESKQQLILEIKGHDPLEEVKRAAAARWIAAVNADRSYGLWKYALVKKVSDIESVISQALK
jgi:type III restriction enzyme